ncbi:MAG TPA: nucleotide-binding protein [Anaeromyxobacter sp.]
MRRLSVVLLVTLAVAGCKKKEAAPQQAAGAQGPEAPASSIKGKVLERLDAEPYSYLRLKTDQGETWVAVPKTDKEQGAEVVVGGAMPMNDFESKTLKRKFALVYFGTLAGAEAPAAPVQPAAVGAAPSPENMRAQHAAAAAGPSDVGSVKVPKAAGGDARTVSEVYAQRSALKEKPVTIRGKVVKYNEGIMGRNWLHIRDGSGAAGKDNDLTITTAEKVAVGDVVVVKGTVRVDKDFGAGYSYPVIVEDAKLSK